MGRSPRGVGVTTLQTDARGSVHRGFLGDRTARFLAVEGAALANLARTQHNLEAEAARLCAEAMVATLLMSAWVKGRERITVQLQGEQPRFAFTADADAEAGIRARFTPHRIPARTSHKLEGLLHAIRADVKTEIYRGITALQGRTLEAALGAHLRESEQSDALLRIGVKQDDTGKITFAGGLMVERLPPHPTMPSLSREAFAHTYAAVMEQPVEDLLVGFAFGKIAGQQAEVLETRQGRWRCDCGQERIEAVLYSLGVTELTAMLEEDGQAEVTCQFCNVPYTVTAERLSALIALHSHSGNES